MIQRKPPAKRAFTGLAGSPLSSVADAAPEPSKRGRPQVHADQAAKQARYRERVAAKKQDHERRQLVAKILKRVRDGLGPQSQKLVGDSVRAANSLHMRRLHVELSQLSIDQLNNYRQTLDTNHDHVGRMWGERSGEADRSKGQSEIEKIIAARQYDVSLGESTEQDPKLAGKFRVRPSGTPPDGMEQHEGHARSESEPAPPDALDGAINRIVAQIDSNSDNQCLYCYEVFKNNQAAENHLYEMCAKAETETRKYHDYVSAVLRSNIPAARSLIKGQIVTPAVYHYDRVVEQSRKRKHGNIVTDRPNSGHSSQQVDN